MVELITLPLWDVRKVEFSDYAMRFIGGMCATKTVLYGDVYGILAAPPCTEFSLAKGGQPHFTYQHWQFGDRQIKPTDIWGYFNEPNQTVKAKPEGMTKRYANNRTQVKNWNNGTCHAEYKALGLDRAAIRAITPKGFSDAFFRANK